MSFDWITFFSSRHIPYVTRGKNVSPGYAGIRCPFCRDDDPSTHLVVSLTRGSWHCWRNKSHSGSSPARLITVLIGCSLAEAKAIAGERYSLVPENLLSTVAARLGKAPPEEDTDLGFPEEFRAFASRASARPYLAYLRDRGFSLQTQDFTDRYGMYYAVDGDQRGRVIFTVVYRGDLVGWTGRTVYGREPRYKAEGAVASRHLLWYDELEVRAIEWAHTLILVEGPFDALKVDMLGRPEGITATCCFTSRPTKGRIERPSDAQMEKLIRVLPRFERKYLLLDYGTISSSFATLDELRILGLEARWLPSSLKDPGELRTTRQLLSIIEETHAHHHDHARL